MKAPAISDDLHCPLPDMPCSFDGAVGLLMMRGFCLVMFEAVESRAFCARESMAKSASAVAGITWPLPGFCTFVLRFNLNHVSEHTTAVGFGTSFFA